MVILSIIAIFLDLFAILLAFTALIASFRNDQEIESIKSWYPFCQILKIKIPEKDDFEWEDKNDRSEESSRADFE